MGIAYVDTSVLTAIAFDDPGAAAHAQRLDEFARLVSSNLLEAELQAAFAGEKQLFQESVTAGIEWILPDRTLAPEFATVLETGYLRRADLWHVATALYVPPNPAASRSPRLTPRKAPLRRRSVFRFCEKRIRRE